MKIAITGGTGFVGRHLARELVEFGHEAVLIARGEDKNDLDARQLPGTHFVQASVDDPRALALAFAGCEQVAHCAGINREMGDQTFRRVHFEGTRHVIDAARAAGLRKILLMSFLRARPNCGSAYHESKWAAEEMVRGSGLDYTVFKCGVIYGKGDHMLDHLSHAFYTFPIFAFVGFRDRPIRPNAVEDIARILRATLLHEALSKRTVAVVGPEQLTLRAAVRRVAKVIGKHPLMFPLPIWFHYGLASAAEALMRVPLVSRAQVRMLAEGLAEPAPACDPLPADLAPRIPFSEEQIRKGLPQPGRFTLSDIRSRHSRKSERHRAFFELP